MTKQLIQEIVHGFAMNSMVVIQHQDEARRQSLELVAEHDHEWRLRCRVWRLEQREFLGARSGEDRTDGGHEVMQENHQIAVVFIQR